MWTWLIYRSGNGIFPRLIYWYLFAFAPVLMISPLLNNTIWTWVMFLKENPKVCLKPHGSLTTLKWEVWNQNNRVKCQKRQRHPARMTFSDVKMFSQKVAHAIKSLILKLSRKFLRSRLSVKINLPWHKKVVIPRQSKSDSLRAIKWSFVGTVGIPQSERENTQVHQRPIKKT